MLRQVFHALALGQVLADQAVGVFVRAAFPGVVGRREIKPGVGRAFDDRVLVSPTSPHPEMTPLIWDGHGSFGRLAIRGDAF